MVQGQNYKSSSTLATFERDQPSKRTGFETMQKKQLERTMSTTNAKSSVTGSTTTSNKYGSWGPVFQNRENFNSMHFC